MKLIVILLFQIFLLVLELESASYNLTINGLDLEICKLPHKCCLFSICNKDDQHESNSEYMCKESDLLQEISRTSISSNCSLNILIERISSTITDARGSPFTPTSMNHQALGSLIPTTTSTPSKQLSCNNGSATNASITQATALGVIAGLSVVIVVLLILAIIGWVCTYLALKKKGTMNVPKTNSSEMETRYRNEPGNTQQESNEDQLQQDLNDERAHLYDIIPPINHNDTPALVVHNTATTNMEEASTEQHTYTAPKREQIRSKNEPPGPLLPDRDVVGGSCDKGWSQTMVDSEAKQDQEDLTNTHIYHILEQQSTEKEVEPRVKDHHKPPAAYEVPVVNTAVSQP